MESSVTIPLADYEELKDTKERFYSLINHNAKSIAINIKEYNIQYMNVLSEDETIKVLTDKIETLTESLNDNIELNRILTAKLEEKRSPFGFLNKIYLYLKK